MVRKCCTLSVTKFTLCKPCCNLSSLCLWSWLPGQAGPLHGRGQVRKLENIMPSLLLPLTMFEIHEVKIVSSSGKNKPNPRVAQRGALRPTCSRPYLWVHWTFSDCLSRSTNSRGHEWGNKGLSALPHFSSIYLHIKGTCGYWVELNICLFIYRLSSLTRM